MRFAVRFIVPGSLPWVVLGLMFVVGCGEDRPEIDTPKPSEFGYQTDGQPSLVDEGRRVYGKYCVGCHGEAGDGNGEAARFLNPKPRNFIKANFKFSSTRSGQLPTEADLHRTIRTGLRGSAMPPFDLLPTRQVDAVIEYIKTFSPKWKDRGPGTPVPFVTDPYRSEPDKSAAIRRGEAVYHGFANCWNCHPSYVSDKKLNEYLVAFGGQRREEFRPRFDQSVGKINTDDLVVYPPDFKRDFVRAGTQVEDLYRSVAAGITGTAMPTWIDSMEVPGEKEGTPPVVKPDDLWAIAYYVRDLIRQRPPLLKEGGFVIRDRTYKADTVAAPSEDAAAEEFFDTEDEKD